MRLPFWVIFSYTVRLMPKQLTNLRKNAATNWKRVRVKTSASITRFPLLSFFGVLLLLLVLIIVGSFLRKPAEEEVVAEAPAQPVEVFQIGGTPNITVQAQVEKSGVIRVVAQSAGVVQQLRVKEGDHVNRGTTLVNLSTNYQGGTIPTVSRQIAQKNYQFAVENYQTQLDLLNQRRAIANQSETQAADLRDISEASLSDTRNLITLQEEQYRLLDETIENLEASGETYPGNATLAQLVPARAGALSALTSLRQALRNTEYQIEGDNPPAELARLQRELTLKQLELEEKSLNLNRDLAKLNLRISQISEALMYPASPCPGVVERVYVKVGQNVAPGTLIATITADSNIADVVALVSGQVADELTMVSPATLNINGHDWELYPRYISNEPTDGTLHAVIFTLPAEASDQLDQSEYVTVQLPLGAPQLETDPYIPVDAVFQTDSTAYVYVVEQHGEELQAATREITLDRIMGEYVMALTGLQDDDRVIISRNVSQGDRVEIK